MQIDSLQTEKMTVMLVDDHSLFRAGLAVLLNKMPEFGDILEYGDGQDALAALQNGTDADLMILDYNLPGMNGLEILKKAKSVSPELPVILLSANIETKLIQSAIASHASGFIPKTASPDVMSSAVQLVLNGGIYIPLEAISTSGVEADSSAEFVSPPRNAHVSANSQLTQRQMDVLAQMKDGLSNKEIARNLNMSPSTVKVHVAAILKELQVASRTQAVVVARDCGLLD